MSRTEQAWFYNEEGEWENPADLIDDPADDWEEEDEEEEEDDDDEWNNWEED